jgi:myosin-1
VFPKGTDKSLADKLVKQLARHPNFAPLNQGSTMGFVVKHYAGDVTYDCIGFLEKNKDLLFIDLVDMMMSSSLSLPKILFKADAHRNDKKRPATQGNQFKLQMNALVATLTMSSPHYVRTIKPNSTKSSNKFELDLVKSQVRYLGLQVCILLSSCSSGRDDAVG